MEYQVIFEPFTERHYIKRFAKKYKTSWDLTLEFLCEEFRKADILFLKSIAETIVDSKDVKICKTEFKIAGTEVSRRASGNRCVIAVYKNTAVVHVLLVYSKEDIRGSNETAGWKAIIKDNYPKYKSIL